MHHTGLHFQVLELAGINLRRKGTSHAFSLPGTKVPHWEQKLQEAKVLENFRSL